MLENCSFADLLALYEKEGAEVSTTQIAFLTDAIYQAYLKAKGARPRRMNDRERNVKQTVVKNVRKSVGTLALFAFAFAGDRWPVPLWLSKDRTKLVPPETLAGIVRDLCHGEPDAYVSPILRELRRYMAGPGERVVVIREA